MTLPRPSSRRAAVVAAGLLAVLLAAGSAFAYWSARGSGNASASTATLSAPSVTVPGTSGSSVTVSWTASSIPGGGSSVDGYYVQRVTSGGTAFAACDTSAAQLATGTSCSDTVTTSGDYTYRVIAVLSSWTAVGTSNTVTVRAAARLAISSAPVSGPASSSPTLGPITVQLQDAAGSAALAAGTTTVDLASTSAGSPRFAASAGGPTVSSVTIPAGASSASFYYSDTRSGTPTVSVAATGLTTDSQPETITAASPSRLAFAQQATDSVAGSSITPAPTVQIQDVFGNLTSSSAAVTVALGAGSPPGALSGTLTRSATNGTASFAGLSLDKVGSGYSLAATSGALSSGTSASFRVTAAPANRLIITSAAQSGRTSAAASLGPITVELNDSFANPTTSATTTTVTLSSNSASTGVFSGSSGGGAVTSLSIPAGSSSASFYYGDTKAGTPTISVSATGLTGASQTETITAGPATKLAYLSGPVSGSASATATVGPITVQSQDSFGNVSAVTSSTVVNLSSTGTGAVFSPASGGAATTSVTLAAGTSSASFYYGDTKAGAPTITVTASGLGSAAQQATISPGSAAKLAFTTAAASGVASSTATMGPITVQMQDGFGNAASAAGATTVNLSSTSTGASFATASGGSGATSVSISAGSSSANLFYGDTKAGTPTVTAGATGLTSATQQETVTAGAGSKLVWTQLSTTSPTPVPAACISANACSYPTFGNFQNLTMSVSVTDAFGNMVSNVGTARSVSVSTTGGTLNSGTGPVTLTVPAAGAATSNTVVFKSPNAGWTSVLLTASVSGNPAYAAATMTVFKN